MWTKALAVPELEDGKSKTVLVADKKLAFFKVGGKFYAMDNACPHRGGPLGEGHVDGEEVICPWHAWSFNVKTGACDTSPSLKQKCFKVKLEKGEVFVDL